MKRTLLLLFFGALLYFAGCSDSQNFVSPTDASRPAGETQMDVTASYNVTLKITQHSGSTNTVLVNQSFSPSFPQHTSDINFSTLASRDGISTFTVEYGATWANVGNYNYGKYYIDKISPASNIYSLSIPLSPTSGGTVNNTISNAGLLENTNYKYKVGIDVVTICCNDD